MASDDYRGVHVFQHNRCDPDRAASILATIFQVAQCGGFREPPGDYAERGKSDQEVAAQRDAIRKAGFPEYIDIVEGLPTELQGKGKTNALKKNFFPDFEKMGFLERNVEPDSTTKLTEAGVELGTSVVGLDRRQAYSKGVERVIRREGELLARVDFIVSQSDRLSLDELMLVVTDDSLSRDRALELVTEIRRLSRFKHDRMMRRVYDRTTASGHDFGNWRNQCQEIAQGFAYICGFAYDGQVELIAPQGPRSAEVFQPSRASAARKAARAKHGLGDDAGFELHHIIPVSYANTAGENELIDCWQNLLPLTPAAHQRIPTVGNVNIELQVDGDSVSLLDPERHFTEFTFVRPSETVFDAGSVEELLKYNQMLVQRFT